MRCTTITDITLEVDLFGECTECKRPVNISRVESYGYTNQKQDYTVYIEPHRCPAEEA